MPPRLGSAGSARLTRRGLLGASAGGAAAWLAGCTSEPTTPPPSPSAPTPVSPTPSGAAGTPGPRIRVALWSGLTGEDNTTLQALAERCNADLPGVDVSYQGRSWGETYTELSSAVLAGEGPELALVQAHWVPTLAARRLVQPMDTVNTALGYRADNFPAPVWRSGSYRLQQFGLPFDLSPLGLFYNRTLMTAAGLDPTRPPTDGTSYRLALDAVANTGVEAQSVSAEAVTGGVSGLSLLGQFGGQFLAENGTQVGWTGEAGLKALTWYRDLLDRDHAERPRSQAEDLRRFREGEVAFRWGLGRDIPELTRADDLAWGVAALPNVGGTPATWCGSHQFVLPSAQPLDADRTRACSDVIAWFMEHGLDWAGAGYLPALTRLRDTREFRAMTDLTTLAGQLDRISMLPAAAGMPELLAEWDACLNRVVTGEADPPTALNESTGRARRIWELNLQRYR